MTGELFIYNFMSTFDALYSRLYRLVVNHNYHSHRSRSWNISFLCIFIFMTSTYGVFGLLITIPCPMHRRKNETVEMLGLNNIVVQQNIDFNVIFVNYIFLLFSLSLSFFLLVFLLVLFYDH